MAHWVKCLPNIEELSSDSQHSCKKQMSVVLGLERQTRGGGAGNHQPESRMRGSRFSPGEESLE